MPMSDTTVARVALAAIMRIPLTPRRILFYGALHRRLPRLRNPQRFTDKVNWRVRHDRRELLAPTCDKLAMKELASATAGDSVRVPQTLWAGPDLRDLGSVDLPDRWILKPAHRFGKIIVGHGQPDIDDLLARTDGWLDNENWQLMGEWGYSRATPRILVEERIGTSDALPSDYKFFVFHGRCEFIQVDTGRFGKRTQNFYRRPWTLLPLSGGPPPAEHPQAAPACLDEMIIVAEKLAASTDFVRVDLYVVDGRVVFGEMTNYPAGGESPFHPESFDQEFGRTWRVPKAYVD